MANTKLDYKKEVTTRLGSKVQVYSVYKDYMNGAWYSELDDRWVPCQWTLHGFFLPPIQLHQQMKTNLDLINNEYYLPEV